jgi:O-antigen/teichoic acid export membrane protein
VSSNRRAKTAGARLVEKAFGREPDSHAGVAPGGRSLTMLGSSLALIFAKVATMGLGFLFWLVAARAFDQAEVGLAAAAVSAVMLCTQLALLGVGSSVILHFPPHARDPKALIDTAFTIVGLASLAAAGCFLLLAHGTLRHLQVVVEIPAFALAFSAMSVLGTAGILFDQVSTVLRRGDQVLVRAVAFGIVNIGLLTALAFGSRSAGALAIFATWVGAAGAAAAIGCFQLWRTVGRYRYSPRLERQLAWPLLRVGVPNHWLTLTERAPGLVLPIVVTELVSPAANAAWYAAWMMAWVLYIIPIQVGMTLFAEASHGTASLSGLLRHGLRSSLVLGTAGAVLVAFAAPDLLSILGSGYAAAGVTPLRLLVVAVVPLTFVQGYFVVCRSTGRLREGIATGVFGAASSIGGAAVAAATSGLVGMALVWLATQVVVGSWAAWRLRRIRLAAERRRASVSEPGLDSSDRGTATRPRLPDAPARSSPPEVARAQ